MGLSPTMTAKDRLQCSFRMLVECGGRDQRGINVGADIGPDIIYSPPRWETVRSLISTAIVFQVRHLGGLH